MSLEATIQENTKAIRALIDALAQGIPTTAAQVAAVVTEAKSEKSESSKKTTAAVSQESPTQTASDNSTSSTETTENESEETTEETSYQDAAAAITKLSRVKGRDAAIALLAKYKANRLPDIKPEKYKAVIADANAQIEAE